MSETEAIVHEIDTRDPPKDEIASPGEVCVMVDPYEGTDRMPPLIPLELGTVKPVELKPSPDSTSVHAIFEELSQAKDFATIFWRLPFMNYEFIYEHGLEDYMPPGEERSGYLRWKLRRAAQDKKKSRVGK
jgi:hypothetical protein